MNSAEDLFVANEGVRDEKICPTGGWVAEEGLAMASDRTNTGGPDSESLRED